MENYSDSDNGNDGSNSVGEIIIICFEIYGAASATSAVIDASEKRLRVAGVSVSYNWWCFSDGDVKLLFSSALNKQLKKQMLISRSD